MNVEQVREFCLGLKNTIETFPFDETTLVFKVENKMYLLIPLDMPHPYVAVKCDPEQVVTLREHYTSVKPAYHFNKKYWNSIDLDGDMPDDDIKQWITHSYHEVIRKLPQKIRIGYGF